MAEQDDKIKGLSDKIDLLMRQQASLIEQANSLKKELNGLRNPAAVPQETAPVEEIKTTEVELPKKVVAKSSLKVLPTPAVEMPAEPARPSIFQANLEKFIGENLINKIGILITVIGVAIGAKYSIDNGLISPATRIALGYMMGIGLLGFGMKLKNKYESYSSVLVSGAMAILYFITYLGYSLYGLFPQIPTFGLMLVFTAFTVYAALNYNRQIIALLGLVGAYAVPFLLSTGSGRVDILFSYMAIINVGILIISLTKKWRTLFYSAFGMTWLIYAGWFVFGYSRDEHFTLAFVFASIFFAIFYATFIAYKLRYKKQFVQGDIIILLFNSFIFFGFGFAILSERVATSQYLGLFTVINAFIHFVVSAAIYKLKLADRNLFYLISGLVLVFITIAIPVQLDGNWVTLLWIGEAALLFWIGRSKNVPIYEKLSYPLMAIASISLLQDWENFYSANVIFTKSEYTNWFTPIFNIQFLSSALFVIALGFIYYTWQKNEYHTEVVLKSSNYALLKLLLPISFLVILYFTFFLEIGQYWSQQLNASLIEVDSETTYSRDFNWDMRDFRSLWLVLYTMLFAAALSLVNIKWFKSTKLGLANLAFNALSIVAFLTLGLYAISELRESYINNATDEFFQHGMWNIGVRYFALALFAAFIGLNYRYIKQKFIGLNLKKIFDVVLHVSIVWVLSSELLSIMNFSGNTHNYKLGLSILWGIYSLAIVAYGIWKDNAFLRIGAIGLFAITLLKVFFYDISHLDTIAKTIVFVSLGLLLLVISFLYNKYKDKITYEEDKNIS